MLRSTCELGRKFNIPFEILEMSFINKKRFWELHYKKLLYKTLVIITQK
jgi:hypothetical protein